MSCYKCGATTELSIKRRLKSGSIYYSCRPCRRLEYQLKNKKKPSARVTKNKNQQKFMEDWIKKSKETNLRISKRFA